MHPISDGRAGIWRPAPPADEGAVQSLREHSRVDLPSAYLTQLAESNGGEGDLGAEPGWVVLWPAERVIEYNDMYDIADVLPGFYGFGDNGGGELLAFDTRTGSPYPVVAIPWIPMEPEFAVRIAPSFAQFRSLIGKVSAAAT